MTTTTITTDGGAAIEGNVTAGRSLGLKPGQQVVFSRLEQGIVMQPVHHDVSAAFGLLKAAKSVSLEEMERAIEARARALHDQC